MTRVLLRPQYLPSAALRSAVVRRVALAWLLLALVVVPTLGRLHQVVHGGALDQAHAGLLAAPSSLPGQTAWDPAPNARSAATTCHSLWLPYLLAHHAPVDCLLLDQLALGDALHAAPLALPAADAPLPLAMHAAGRASTPHIALFHARGPPVA